MAYTTRQSLLKGILEQNEDAWRDFYNFYKPLSRIILRRRGLPESELDDLHQMVMVDLFKKGCVERYQKERGRFRVYLQKIIHNKCCDLMTRILKEKAKQEGLEEKLCLEWFEEEESQEQWEKVWQEFLNGKALEILRQEVSEQQYMIFDLYALQQLPVKDVSKILKVSENQVYLAKSRLTDRLVKIMQQLEDESL